MLNSILLDPLWNVDADRRKIPGLKTDGRCCEAIMFSFTREPHLPLFPAQWSTLCGSLKYTRQQISLIRDKLIIESALAIGRRRRRRARRRPIRYRLINVRAFLTPVIDLRLHSNSTLRIPSELLSAQLATAIIPRPSHSKFQNKLTRR